MDMESMLKCIMLFVFCAAIALLLTEHLRSQSKADAAERFSLILTELGFTVGAFTSLQSAMVFAACYLGMLLTLFTLLFTWPEKKSENAEV